MELLADRPNIQLSSEQIASALHRIQAFVFKQVEKGAKFTVKDVSSALNLSEYNINKILIKGSGETFKSFVANCKAELAKNHQPVSADTLRNARKVTVCLSARKRGVDLFHLSPKRARLQ